MITWPSWFRGATISNKLRREGGGEGQSQTCKMYKRSTETGTRSASVQPIDIRFHYASCFLRDWIELKRFNLAPLLGGLCPAARAGEGAGPDAVTGDLELLMPLLLLASIGGVGLCAGAGVEGGGGGGGVQGSAVLRGAVGVGAEYGVLFA
jgi:hypothetical protein